MESFWASSSGVVYGLDHTLTELTLELAIGVEPERLEPGPLLLLGGTREQLAKIGYGAWKLAVGGQGHKIDVGLGARDGVVVEARES